MDSGKTTLVAALVHRGLGYLTDEAAAINPTTLAIDPFPSRSRSSSARGTRSNTCVPSSTRGSRIFADEQWHVVPEAIRPAAIASAAPARLVVSPRYVAAADTRWNAPSRAEGVMLLRRDSFNFASHKAKA